MCIDGELFCSQALILSGHFYMEQLSHWGGGGEVGGMFSIAFLLRVRMAEIVEKM